MLYIHCTCYEDEHGEQYGLSLLAAELRHQMSSDGEGTAHQRRESSVQAFTQRGACCIIKLGLQNERVQVVPARDELLPVHDLPTVNSMTKTTVMTAQMVESPQPLNSGVT